jgi:hypothetical protein
MYGKVYYSQMANKIKFDSKYLFSIDINLDISATKCTAHIPAFSPCYLVTGHMDA